MQNENIPLMVFKTGPDEPTDYADRKTAKIIVIDGEGNSLLFSSYLIGGGVEEGETFEEALHREALEEAGITVEIIRPLGEIIAYRDSIKKRYVTQGYLCKYIKTVSEPTTIDPDEIGKKPFWEKLEDSIVRLEADIQDLRTKNPASYEGDIYYAKLYNREQMLMFLKEAMK